MKRACLFFIVISIICSGFFRHSLLYVLADEPAETFTRYYTSVKIQEGESLWSIAQKYVENSGMTIPEYIEELKFMNRLSSDTIHAGGYLTVVYFKEDFEE